MKFVGISNCENSSELVIRTAMLSRRTCRIYSHCKPTCTAYLANVTEQIVATSGFTPAMPATIMYVVVRSNMGDRARAEIELAALISAPWIRRWNSILQWMNIPLSPMVSWQTSPLAVQCASG